MTRKRSLSIFTQISLSFCLHVLVCVSFTVRKAYLVPFYLFPYVFASFLFTPFLSIYLLLPLSETLPLSKSFILNASISIFVSLLSLSLSVYLSIYLSIFFSLSYSFLLAPTPFLTIPFSNTLDHFFPVNSLSFFHTNR